MVDVDYRCAIVGGGGGTMIYAPDDSMLVFDMRLPHAIVTWAKYDWSPNLIVIRIAMPIPELKLAAIDLQESLDLFRGYSYRLQGYPGNRYGTAVNPTLY